MHQVSASDKVAVHARARRLEGGQEHARLNGCTGMYFPKMLSEMFGNQGGSDMLSTLGGAGNVPVILNERRVYQRGSNAPPHPEYGQLELWWAEGHWWLGPASVCGQAFGLLRLAGQFPFPEGVTWSLNSGKGQKWEAANVRSTQFYEESEKATQPTEPTESERDAGGTTGADQRGGRGGDVAQGEESEVPMTEDEAKQWWRDELNVVKELLGAR